MKLPSRLLGGGALALSLVALSSGVAHASSVGCTDSWINSSGGTWDTATDWSTGAVPSSTDSVCITAAGTYTVVVGNETISVANLTVGGAGADATLQIGNGGSGYAHVNVSGGATTASGSTISDGWGGTFTAGTLTNAGTFLVPSTGYTSYYQFGGVSNTGTFTVEDPAAVTLTNGAVFDNAGGTMSVGGTGTALTFSSPTAGGGTLELDSGGQVDLGSTTALTVADETVVDGGSICGGPLTIGSADGGTGGTLSFVQTGTGPSCPTGQESDTFFITNTSSTLAGTIPAADTVIAGDGGSSYNFTTLSGDVINQGTFEPGYGATVIGSGTTDELTNQGKLIVPTSGYISALNTTLVNTGAVTVDAPTTVSLGTGQSWTNGTNGTNGSISVASGTSLAISGPSGATLVTQDGAISPTGTITVSGNIQVNGGSICGGPVNLGNDGQTGGTLSFATKPAKGAKCAPKQLSDEVYIRNVTASLATNVPSGYTVAMGDGGAAFAHVSTPGALTNAGALVPGFGATLTVNGTLTNTGTIAVPASGYTNTGIVAPSLVNTGTIKPSAALSLTGSLTNDKALSIAKGVTVSVSGTYTQGAAGTFADAISTKGHGLLSVTGAAALAGTATLTGSLAKGTQVQIIQDGGTAGQFSTTTGPFTLTYGATGVTATTS